MSPLQHAPVVPSVFCWAHSDHGLKIQVKTAGGYISTRNHDIFYRLRGISQQVTGMIDLGAFHVF